MSPSRLYPSGFRLFRRSRRFSSIRTSTLSMSSGSCCVSSRNFRNSGRNEDTRFFHFTFLSNLMWPLRARMVSVPKRDALFNGVPLGAARGVVRVSLKPRSEEHTSELQSPCNLVCRLLLEKKKEEPDPEPEIERSDQHPSYDHLDTDA